MRQPALKIAFLIIGTTVLGLGAGCKAFRQTIVKMSSPDDFTPKGDPSQMKATFDELDAVRTRIDMQLVPLVTGFKQPTDIQFIPGQKNLMIVLEKEGRAVWVSLGERKSRGTFLSLNVRTDSEEGLLGLTFHPHFPEKPLAYVNYVTRVRGHDTTRISEWSIHLGPVGITAASERVLLEVRQPYANHKAGQLAFGPDGYLYIPLGDGGYSGDPHENGQNIKVLLGKVLRIDVDRADPGKPYGIPADNPFAGQPGARGEIWAWGLRNPYRFDFDTHGRPVVGDVGQNAWEEITVVEKGTNHGWDIREGRHCYPENRKCSSAGLVDPIYEYAHGKDGSAVIAGKFYRGQAIPGLHGKFVFGDFISGKIWAMDIPKDLKPVTQVYALGKWPVLISTFGQDFGGNLYAADMASGTIFKFEAASAPKTVKTLTQEASVSSKSTKTLP